ncbi:MAG: hypothetical protein ACHQ1D_01275 [Nitrososphaerales archaeon]
MWIKFVCPICESETNWRPKRIDQSIRMYCKCGNYMKEIEFELGTDEDQGFQPLPDDWQPRGKHYGN